MNFTDSSPLDLDEVHATLCAQAQRTGLRLVPVAPSTPPAHPTVRLGSDELTAYQFLDLAVGLADPPALYVQADQFDPDAHLPELEDGWDGPAGASRALIPQEVSQELSAHFHAARSRRGQLCNIRLAFLAGGLSMLGKRRRTGTVTGMTA